MLTKLSLFDFRNYSEKKFSFQEKNVVFFGGNGRGKTNILEAISILSVGKSWRETSTRDLIRHGEDSAKIEAESTEKDHYKALISGNTRTFFRNEKKVSLREYFGRLPTLLFAPEHFLIFSGQKRVRQRFFDRFLFQVFPRYREVLSRFNRALKQKNALLRQNYEKGAKDVQREIQPWNEILAETIPEILTFRKEFLRELNPVFKQELQAISGEDVSIEIELKITEKWVATPEGVLDFFVHHRKQEEVICRCLIGAHRDDFSFVFREKPLLSTASRGEERSILLALLSAQKKILEKKTHCCPILLLDDVFSELDQSRQDYLENLCNESQIFFTTTHESHFENFSLPVQKIEI